MTQVFLLGGWEDDLEEVLNRELNGMDRHTDQTVLDKV